MNGGSKKYSAYKVLIILCLLSFLLADTANSQAFPDSTFEYEPEKPLVKENSRTICIDEYHNNLHTVDSGFIGFAKIMRKNGFNVIGLNSDFVGFDNRYSCSLMVIVNALHISNVGNWTLPNPSAFSPQEIDYLTDWVQKGGRLLMIADHMPYSGAANDLAGEFGFSFSNGFAYLDGQEGMPNVFSKDNERLSLKFSSTDTIKFVSTFMGSAFQYPANTEVILRFLKGDYSLEPEVAWEFPEDTDRIDLENYAQGAILLFGKGKVAVFGESAMFTSQIIKPENGDEFKVGFTSEKATYNIDFILQLTKWLIDL